MPVIITRPKPPKGSQLNKLTVAEYSDMSAMVRVAKEGIKKYDYDASDTSWQGGTLDYLTRGAAGHAFDFVDAAADLVDKFSNLAIQDYGIDLEQNLQVGVLDYNIAMAGDPMCMFGPSMTQTTKAAVNIYIDPWTSANIRPAAMQERGVAMLALVQALQIYRPVNVYLVKGSRFTPKNADTIQIARLPTVPMDLARATFALCSPTVNRIGFLSAIQAVHKSPGRCPSPPLTNSKWQLNNLGGWLAEQHGVTDYVYLPRMSSENGFWTTETNTVEWVKSQLHKFIGN